jgi:hypothetical protein
LVLSVGLPVVFGVTVLWIERTRGSFDLHLVLLSATLFQAASLVAFSPRWFSSRKFLIAAMTPFIALPALVGLRVLQSHLNPPAMVFASVLYMLPLVFDRLKTER